MESTQKNVKFKTECAKFHKSRTGKTLRNLKDNRDYSHLRGTREALMRHWPLRRALMGRWVEGEVTPEPKTLGRRNKVMCGPPLLLGWLFK